MMTQTEIKMKNNILAIDAAAPAMPVKPNIPATIAMIRNMNDHFNIAIDFRVKNFFDL
jgi:hypothetical protein